MKKVLFFLIIVCMLFVSCKDKGNESASNPAAAATTPLEGSWKNTTTNTTINTTTESILAFAGANFTYTLSIKDASNNPATLIWTLVYTGTFRLDNTNLYAKFNAVSYTDATNTTPITDPTAIINAMSTTSIPLTSLPLNPDNTEHLYGTFAINGNTLTIADPSDPSDTEEYQKL